LHDPAEQYLKSRAAVQRNRKQGRTAKWRKSYKVIDVVGTSKEGFAKAAESPAAEDAETVRGVRSAQVVELKWNWTARKSSNTAPRRRFNFDIEK